MPLPAIEKRNYPFTKRPNGTAAAAASALGISTARLYKIIQKSGQRVIAFRLRNVGLHDLAAKFDNEAKS